MISNLSADVDAFTSNVFLVRGERSVLVDAGTNFDVVSSLEDAIEDLDAVVLTHAHPDHVGNLEAITDAFDVAVRAFDGAQEGVDQELTDGGTVQIGDHEYVALHTPGHAPDHLCLYSARASVLFAGDLVFEGGNFGRTDIPGADRETLLASLDRLLDRVDEDLAELHAGHGPSVSDGAYPTIERAREFAAG